MQGTVVTATGVVRLTLWRKTVFSLTDDKRRIIIGKNFFFFFLVLLQTGIGCYRVGALTVQVGAFVQPGDELRPHENVTRHPSGICPLPSWGKEKIFLPDSRLCGCYCPFLGH